MFVLFDPKTQMRVEARKKSGYNYDAKCSFESERAAKSARTRLARLAEEMLENRYADKKYWSQDFSALEILTVQEYNEIMENTMVEKTNLISGKKFWIRRDAPLSCDPSTETYHCM